jgi:hypothetical protein
LLALLVRDHSRQGILGPLASLACSALREMPIDS